MALALLVPRTRVRGQALDRVVASIGDFAITESDVEKEARFERFVNDAPAHSDSANAPAFDSARDRLIDQKLLEEEADNEGISSEGLANDAAARLAEIRKRYGNNGSFETALRDLGMAEQEVLNRLETQQRILRLIDERFRPAALVNAADIKEYYRETFLPAYAKQHPGAPPPLAEVESQIREILTQKQVDNLLDQWLDQTKKSRKVRIHNF